MPLGIPGNGRRALTLDRAKDIEGILGREGERFTVHCYIYLYFDFF